MRMGGGGTGAKGGVCVPMSATCNTAHDIVGQKDLSKPSLTFLTCAADFKDRHGMLVLGNIESFYWSL